MKLFALKCEGGYIKKYGEKVICVDLYKASVYNSKTSEELNALFQKAINADVTNLRVVELEIIEKDPVE